MSTKHTGNMLNEITREEHRTVGGIDGKAIFPYNYDTLGGTVTPSGGLAPFASDYLSLAQTSTTDTYTFKSGGSGGTTVQTLTITYTDPGKTIISSVVRS